MATRTTTRAPMKFDLGERTHQQPVANTTPPNVIASDAGGDLVQGKRKAEQVDRQQIGARVTKATYRKLKAIAALRGETVQTLVEKAIDDFLEKTSDLVTKISNRQAE